MSDLMPPTLPIHHEVFPSFDLWTIRRPERGNGLGPSVVKQFHLLSQKINPDRPMVITAAPISGRQAVQQTDQPPVWIAGGDLRELDQLGSKAEIKNYICLLHDFQVWMEERPGPVIMAIDGLAIGGGAEFALCGDIRLASASSQWSFKQGALGLMTGFGGASRLVTLAGLSRAERALYGMQTLNAQTALDWGLIHDVAPSTRDLWILVERWVETLGAWNQESFASQKHMLRATRQYPSGTHRALEAELFVKIWGNPLHQAKVKAFLDRVRTTPS